MGHRRARPRHSAGIWFAAALLAAFATAFVISLSRGDRVAGAPASSALGPAPPVALPLAPAGLRTVAPIPHLRRTAQPRAAVQTQPATARPVGTAAPTVTPTPTPTPTPEAIPEAPAPTPAPRQKPTKPPTVGQEFDSSG
jgi:outer membrane biosynthesis protein TonB